MNLNHKKFSIRFQRISVTKLISGITFIKNGLTLGYPVVESIKSIDNLCDEIIINVGFDDEECTEDDGTYKLLKETFKGDKYIFLKSFWDPEMLSASERRQLKRACCSWLQGLRCQQ